MQQQGQEEGRATGHCQETPRLVPLQQKFADLRRRKEEALRQQGSEESQVPPCRQREPAVAASLHLDEIAGTPSPPRGNLKGSAAAAAATASPPSPNGRATSCPASCSDSPGVAPSPRTPRASELAMDSATAFRGSHVSTQLVGSQALAAEGRRDAQASQEASTSWRITEDASSEGWRGGSIEGSEEEGADEVGAAVATMAVVGVVGATAAVMEADDEAAAGEDADQADLMRRIQLGEEYCERQRRKWRLRRREIEAAREARVAREAEQEGATASAAGPAVLFGLPVLDSIAFCFGRLEP